MVRLRWYRRSAGHWVLKSESGEIFAIVHPFREGRKGMYRGTALGEERNRYIIRKYGGVWWTTGQGVAAAKRNIVQWLERHTWDRFKVVA